MEVDYHAVRSPHVQIADWLQARIEAGEWSPGRRIASETDVVQVTGVARTTARRAFALLRERGVIYTVPGRGSFAGKPEEEA